MRVIYDKDIDTLIIIFGENRPAVSIDCEGEFWLRKDPETNEMVGIEIENFKKVFLKKYLG